MDRSSLELIVRRIDYRRGITHIDVGEDMNRGLWIEIRHQRPDTYTGVTGWGNGGVRWISDNATESDVVRTIFSAFAALEEHECREAFTYCGARVFGPHMDIDALMHAAGATNNCRLIETIEAKD